MPFGIKILVGALGIGSALMIGTALWSRASEPCTPSTTTTASPTAATAVATGTAAATTTTSTTDPCTSSNSRRGLRSIFNSRSTTGGGTDVGK